MRDRNYFFDKKFNVMKMEANVSSARTAQNTAHLDFQLNPRDLVLIEQISYQVIEWDLLYNILAPPINPYSQLASPTN